MCGVFSGHARVPGGHCRGRCQSPPVFAPPWDPSGEIATLLGRIQGGAHEGHAKGPQVWRSAHAASPLLPRVKNRAARSRCNCIALLQSLCAIPQRISAAKSRTRASIWLTRTQKVCISARTQVQFKLYTFKALDLALASRQPRGNSAATPARKQLIR